MRFGMMAAIQFTSDQSFAAKIQDALAEVRAAREAGFDIITMGQHHLVNPFIMPSMWPYLGRLAADAGDMRLACGVALSSMHNPVDLAEQVMTMDAITDGRFVCGVGIGYREEEFAAFGVRRGERLARFLEALEIMKLVWTQDTVEYDGRFWQLPKVRVTTKPVQRPHPPIWIACNADKAVERAGRMGHPWLVNPHATVATVQQQMEVYRRGLEEGGRDAPAELPMMRELYIHEDRETAWREAQPYLYAKYQAYASWGQDKALPGDEDFTAPFQELARDRFIIGTPEDCAQELQRYRDELGVTTMIARLQWPGMPHEKTLNVIRLIGEQVLPRLA